MYPELLHAPYISAFDSGGGVWFVFLNQFQWSTKADAFPRLLPMILVLYHPDVLAPSLSLNDGVLTMLCLNLVFVHLVPMKERSAMKKKCIFSTNHIVLRGQSWLMWLIMNLLQNAWQGHLLNFRPQIFYAGSCSMLLSNSKTFKIGRFSLINSKA